MNGGTRVLNAASGGDFELLVYSTSMYLKGGCNCKVPVGSGY